MENETRTTNEEREKIYKAVAENFRVMVGKYGEKDVRWALNKYIAAKKAMEKAEEKKREAEAEIKNLKEKI